MLFLNIILYPLRAMLDLFFTWVIAALLVNWWAPLFAKKRRYFNRGDPLFGFTLPAWLAWFDTFDGDLDTGAANGSITGSSTYWNRVKWLYRNNAYGWSYWVLGMPFVASDWRVVRYEQSAAQITFIAVEPGGKFNINATRCGLHFKLGWKAWNNYDTVNDKWNDQPWGPAWRIPFVFSISRA